MPLIVPRTGGTKRLLVPLLVLLPVIGLLALAWSRRADPDPIFVPRPATFAPGVHLLGELSPSVAYVIETTDGLILVDTSLDEHHSLLLKQFEMLGLDIQDLKMILVTHGHGDHYLGAVNLQRLTGAKLYAGQADSQILRNAGPREAVFSTYPMDHVDIHSTVVDVELVGGEIIELGDARIHVIATPGHTPGSVCFLLKRDGRTALFSGDTIMTITGDLGTYATYLAPRYRGDPSAYLKTLRELEQLPAPDLLLPGHPQLAQETISAKLTPHEWSSLLSQGIQKMEELTKRYAADGADFLDGNPKELLPGLHYLGDFSNAAVYCFSNQSSIVLFDAPGGPEFLDFLTERLNGIGLNLFMLTAVAVTGTGPESTAGLRDLTKETGCQIIASRSDQDEIRQICPDVSLLLLTENEANQHPWLPLRPIPLKGFNRIQTAYAIEWQGKQVLVSGRFPAKITNTMIPQLQRMRFDPTTFAQTLSRIERVEPDLWLPAKPIHGQNANLYEGDWQDMLRQTRLFLIGH
jgi:glyoxylase-like metal-dependent hydrolase (beta-lactamase superfamily II)